MSAPAARTGLLALVAMIRKEFRQLRRNPTSLRFMLVMPVVQVLMMGFAMTMQVRHVPTLLVDLDRSAVSRNVLSEFRDGPLFDIQGTAYSLDRVRSEFDAGQVALAVVIPDHFERDLRDRRTPEVQLELDGVNGNEAEIAAGYASAILASAAAPYGHPGGLHVVTVVPRAAFNPNLHSRYYYIPGMVTLAVMFLTVAMAAMSIVRERERGTYDQLMVTPLPRSAFIIGKLIPFAILALVAQTLALTMAVIVFQIPIRGSLWLFFCFSVIFQLSSLGLGLVMSAASQTQQQAMFLAWFFLVVVMMLSGFFAPIENAPRIIEWISRADPMRYYIEASREILIKGSGLAVLWPEAVTLLGFGVVLLAAGTLLVHKRSG